MPVITHDNEIAEEAERVIRIRDGKVVEDYINPGYEEKYGRESKKNNKNPNTQVPSTVMTAGVIE